MALNGMQTCKLSTTIFFVRLHIMVDQFVCFRIFHSSLLLFFHGIIYSFIQCNDCHV